MFSILSSGLIPVDLSDFPSFKWLRDGAANYIDQWLFGLVVIAIASLAKMLWGRFGASTSISRRPAVLIRHAALLNQELVLRSAAELRLAADVVGWNLIPGKCLEPDQWMEALHRMSTPALVSRADELEAHGNGNRICGIWFAAAAHAVRLVIAAREAASEADENEAQQIVTALKRLAAFTTQAA